VKQIGAVLVKGNRIIGTGYNGTVEGSKNCDDGGCARCQNVDGLHASGRDYDLCVCVHAETNALLTAARFGTPVEGATIYSTDQPCFMCSKALIQAGVKKSYYRKDWLKSTDIFPPGIREDYERLQTELRAEKVSTTFHDNHHLERGFRCGDQSGTESGTVKSERGAISNRGSSVRRVAAALVVGLGLVYLGRAARRATR
jgi:dCMP deaminase